MSKCAGSAVSSCRQRSNECVTVKRGGVDHHCRSRPTRRPKSLQKKASRPHKPTKAKSSKTPKKKTPLASAKQKVWSFAQKVTKPCDDFALKQRNGTCYMAAATLMFGRVALTHCKSEGVRQYVRRSMANAWDDAQGSSNDEFCPRIPKAIRQFYSDLRDNVKFYLHENRVYHIGDMGCALYQTCSDKELMQGGVPSCFLTALFWASYSSLVGNKPCTLTTRAVNIDTYSGTLEHFLRRKVLKDLRKIPFQIVDLVIKPGLSLNANTIVPILTFTLKVVYETMTKRSMHLHGVMLTMVTEDGSSGHVISLFPCLKGGDLRWTFCNSWGDACSRNLGGEFEQMRLLKGYTHVKQMTFLIGS